VKVGDLVRFTGGPVFSAAERRYAASGLIIGVTPADASGGAPAASYTVLWADGKTTNEWFSYLEALG
jgi:hypothetical protein